jgi:hypothetical protein
MAEQYQEGQRLQGSDGKIYVVQGGVPREEITPPDVASVYKRPKSPERIAEEERKVRGAEIEEERLDITKRGEATGLEETKRKGFLDLVTKYEGDDRVTKYQKVLPIYNTMLSVAARPNPSKADDNLLVTYFSKIKDPTTGVLGGEFETSKNVQTLYDKYKTDLQGLYDPEVGFVSPAARQQFIRATNDLVASDRQAYRVARDRYRQLATDPTFGQNPDAVIGEDFANSYAEQIKSQYMNVMGGETSEAPVAGVTAALPGDRVVAEKDLQNARDLQAAWQSGKSIEELNAISMANVGSPLTPESIAALTADTNRQLQFTPYIAPMEDVTKDMGIVEGLVESVTGSERSTPEIEAAADWTTMPELNELSIAGAKTGIGTLFTSPEESVQIIQANYPGVEVRQDSKGNYILRSQDGKDYGIKPGFRFSDVPRAAAGIFAFTPAGRAATFTGAALKSGATQAAIEGTEFAAGGEFNAQPIALATTFGAGGKVIEDVASAALPRVVDQVRRMRGQPEIPLGAAPEAPAGMAMPSATTMAPEAPVTGAVAPTAPTITTPASSAPASRPGGGAMSTSEETIRAQRAAELPVPIELARFQRTRDFTEQQRARELAKNNEVGGPIRDRMAQQQDELRQNFERFIEGTGSEVWNNPYEQGGVISDALATLAKRERTRTNALYKRAEKAGEMREPVSYQQLTDFIGQQTPTTREKLAPVLKTVEEQLLSNDPSKTGMISLNQMEDIRKLINKVASPGTPDASFGRDMRMLIDDATKDAGGDVYKQARASRAKYARDFEDIDLVEKVFANKPGSTDRFVALEKVTDKITGDGTPLDSVKHLLGLLDRAGPRGARAKRELQGSVMEKIRDQAYRGITSDESGQAVIQPAALNKIITSLNKNGKLDLIFDKKTAELLNTINDVTKDIITSPPGSVNASGTSSGIMNAIDTLGTFGTTGLPVPAAKILNDFRKAMAARGMRKEVKRLLD